MPNNTLEKWEEKTIIEIASVATGRWDASHSKDKGAYKFFTCASEPMMCNTFKWDDECLILPGNGVNVGDVYYYKGKFDAYQRTYVISNIKYLLVKYLYYYLQCYWKWRNLDKQYGAATNYIKIGNFQNFVVSYPSEFEEQQRIVGILDEAFENIEKAKQNTLQNLNNAKELFESSLNNLLSKDYSNVKKLDDICKITSKLTDPRLPQNQYLLHVGGANIEQKNGMLINLMTAKEEKLISNKFIFDDKMVLYSKIRPYLRKVVRPNFSGLCSADIYPLLPDTNYITRDYLFYLLLSKSFTEYAIEGSARAGMPKVNRPHLFAYTCKLPTIIEQQKIVQQLDELQEQTKKLEQIYEQKIKDLDELKQSILQKAFNGEL